MQIDNCKLAVIFPMRQRIPREVQLKHTSPSALQHGLFTTLYLLNPSATTITGAVVALELGSSKVANIRCQRSKTATDNYISHSNPIVPSLIHT